MKNALLAPVELSAHHTAERQKIDELVRHRYFQWLITTAVTETEDLRDGILDEDFIDDAVAIDAATRKQNQRLLLDVEKEGEIRRAEAKREAAVIREQAKKVLANHMRKHMKQQLGDTTHVMLNLLQIPANFADLINDLFKASIGYRDLNRMIKSIPGLEKKLISMVNDRDFCKSIGRECRPIKDGLAALGSLGIPGLRLLIPMLVVKQSTRFRCPFYPMMGHKIWSYTTTMANSTRFLLKEVGYGGDSSNELDGVVAGLFHSFGLIAIHHQFARSFEEVKTQCLTVLRENQNRPLYNAMLEVEADLTLMMELLLEMGDDITLRVSESFDWQRMTHLQAAIRQVHDRIPLNERTLHAIAMEQARSYAQFEMLRRAKRFTAKEHVRPFLDHVQIYNDHINKMVRADVRKINLREYIGK